MGKKTTKRLSQILREFNVGRDTILDFLHKKGIEINPNPNTKVPAEAYELLRKEYSSDSTMKEESKRLNLRKNRDKSSVSLEDLDNKDEAQDEVVENETEDVVLIQDNSSSTKDKKSEKSNEEEEFKSNRQKPRILGKIDLDNLNRSKGSENTEQNKDNTKNPAPPKKEAEKTEPEQQKQEKQKQQPVEKQEEKEKTSEKDEKTAPVEKNISQPQENAPAKNSEPKNNAKQSTNDNVDNKESEKLPEKKTEESKPVAEEKKKKDTANPKSKDEQKPQDKKDDKSKVVPEKKETKDENKPPRKEKNKPSQKRKKEEKPRQNKPEKKKPETDNKKEKPEEEALFRTEVKKLSGPTVVGKIDLPTDKKRKKDKSKDKTKDGEKKETSRRRRRRRSRRNRNKQKDQQKNNQQQQQQQQQKKGDQQKGGGDQQKSAGQKENQKQRSHRDQRDKDNRNKRRRQQPSQRKEEVNEEDVQKQIKETLARLQSRSSSKTSKHKREKKEEIKKRRQKEVEKQESEKNLLKVTEFVALNELANMMKVPPTQLIEICFAIDKPATINQRLDAETIQLIVEELGFEVEFVGVDVQESIQEEEDRPEDLTPRPPIVTVMGHVDHGKTSLLDHIRKTNVIAGEAGGITQHIGAYTVKLPESKTITFLDTPGHQAFTAMRARGAQLTDIAIIVVAADDNVMPQTIEAINHAQAAGVPIVFAINKIDKPGANPDKIKEQLAKMNYLVEDWGGKYQSQDISAKQGLNVEELLESVLLEAEMLELKANPKKRGVGWVIESALDRGRGYVATLLVKAGSVKIGDVMLAGAHMGKVKAMFNERGKRIKKAGPSTPVQVLGLSGAPQAGDEFNVMPSERDAKDIANKRGQLQRQQSLRSQKHITLDEIGRRIAIGNFVELNIIIKGDVDGSVEALADALSRLSTEEIQVKIIHSGVGQISESDVMLATASNAIIIGFQVRPSVGARKLAETEGIDIRLYSIIYDAINEIKDAMEGMLSPDIKEEITGSAEVREVFKISRVGTIAGCMVKDGKINRNNRVRLIRDGIVVHTGLLASLKRHQDDVKEVVSGYECGLNIEKYNDVKVGDVIEAFKEVEVKKKL